MGREKESLSVALLGSYVPRRCGIATFTHDLAVGLAEHVYNRPLSEHENLGILAVTDQKGGYDYGPEVIFDIRQHRKDDFHKAAEFFNISTTDVLCVQHEYGLFGGADGSYLLELLDRINKPVVTTLHTVLSEPSDGQYRVMLRLCECSDRVVVMAERAQEILQEVYGIDGEKIRLVHHGVPDLPLCDPNEHKGRFKVAGQPTILTFGLLSPNKGIELMLDALTRVVPDHPNLVYIVLGATHPTVRRESGESYRLSLEARAVDNGIEANVVFHNQYVSLNDLCGFLQAADIYVTPYKGMEQVVSGTLAYAMACGKPIVSTPYWYAQEMLRDGRGILVEVGDVDGLAQAVRNLLEDDQLRESIRRRTYDFSRQMIWRHVCSQYYEISNQAFRAFSRSHDTALRGRRASARQTLPEVRLDHLKVMTDDTGMLQHAVHATPDRSHGYCADDNARALIVASTAWWLFRDDELLPLIHVYLSYLHFSQIHHKGVFRNFLSYDRQWLDEKGSEDCQGRVLWALGFLVAHAPNESLQSLGKELFESAIPHVEGMVSLRALAFTTLGCVYYPRQSHGAANVQGLMEFVVSRLNGFFLDQESPEWPWPEDKLTYDNARLAQALILAARELNLDDMLHRGLRVLNWLLEVQTDPAGHLSVIGNDGWYPRGGEKARFDQQPLEAAALIDACRAAYQATKDGRWLEEMERCFDWYVGRNDVGMPLVDFKTRGCRDGLKTSGVNQNQGAESTLAWLQALLTMIEMRSGDPTSLRDSTPS